MSRFTYFLKLNTAQFKTLSAAGGNVDLNINNMPVVATGVFEKLGLEVTKSGNDMLNNIVEGYEGLLANLEKLATMKSGYIVDLADGSQKFLNKKMSNFYTDLAKLLNDNEENATTGKLFLVFGFLETIKVVVDGALDLTNAILKISYNDVEADVDDVVKLNTTLGSNPTANTTASDNNVMSEQGFNANQGHPSDLPYNVVLDKESK